MEYVEVSEDIILLCNSYNEKGNAIGVNDYFVVESIKGDYPLFVSGGIIYIYNGKTYECDINGAITKKIIQRYIEKNLLRSTTVSGKNEALSQEICMKGGSGLSEKITYSYYTSAQASQNAFFRLPRALYEKECFRGLRNDAKTLYALILSRRELALLLRKKTCQMWITLLHEFRK